MPPPRTRQNDTQKALQASVASVRAQLTELPSGIQVFGVLLIIIYILAAGGTLHNILAQPAYAGVSGRQRSEYTYILEGPMYLYEQYSAEGLLATAALFLASGGVCLLYWGADERPRPQMMRAGLLCAVVGCVAYGYLGELKMRS